MSRRERDAEKARYWQRTIREAGTFQFPFAQTGRKELAAWELAVLLEGIDLNRGKRRKRYSLPESAGSAEESEGQKRQEP